MAIASNLDAKTRRCTVYDKRPNTCRLHPQVGPKPGYCPYGAVRQVLTAPERLKQLAQTVVVDLVHQAK
jgi:Fe-S-cluster containining protein